MGSFSQRFTGVSRFGLMPNAHSFRMRSSGPRSFKMNRPGKEKMMGKAVGSYMPQNVKKQLRTLEEQIAHAAGAGKKTFTDAHGVEHKVTEEMRYFAKEAREGGHTLTKRSEVKKFAEGFIETARETKNIEDEDPIHLRGGYNIGSKHEVAGKIVKEEEKGLAPEKPRYSAEDKRREFHARTAEIRARIGLPGSSQSTGSMAPAPTIGEVKPVQPIAPGSVHAPGPTKATSAGHPAGLVTTPYFGGGHRTEADSQAPEPTVVAPTSDPLTEENQSVAESIPAAKDIELPNTKNVDRDLPF